jgi:ATP-dependent DNA helicase recG-like protein/SIR2-like protein
MTATTNQTTSLQRTTVQRIAAELLDPARPRPTLLLGAGASVRSGVPAVPAMCELMARWAFLRETGRSVDDPTITRSDWLPWLERHSWYRADLAPELQYPILMERLLTPREERRRFLLDVCNPRDVMPSEGYTALARLMQKGWITTVLTPNFDDRLEVSVRRTPGLVAVYVNSPADAHAISTDPRFPQIVFVHGRAEQYTDLNLADETYELNATLLTELRPVLRDHPLIVVGYRGGEPSVMHGLLGELIDMHGFRHGIYWCHLPEERLHPNVVDLAARAGRNFHAVEIRGFDQLLVEFEQASPWNPAAPRHRAAKDDAPADAGTTEHRPNEHNIDERILEGIALRLRLDTSTAVQPVSATLDRLGLVREVDHEAYLTSAGARFFGAELSRVRLVVDGEEQTIVGGVSFLYQRLLDLLEDANAPFRLKGPDSIDVRPYPPLALRELLVNALAHRDYDRDEPIEVIEAGEWIKFRSPGGLVPGVDANRLGRPGVRGYRNPLLANAMYGAGMMDKQGSGLADVLELAAASGTEASFTVDDWFVATLGARPDRPRADGRPALAGTSWDVYWVNALPITIPRRGVDFAASLFGDRRRVWNALPGEPTPPFQIWSGSLITLSDLRSSENPLRKVIRSDVETFALAEMEADVDRSRLVVRLLNESLGRHAQDLGLHVDWAKRRLWYEATNEADTVVTYRARTRTTTRTVVKARRRPDTSIAYYEHHAVEWSFERLGDDWHLLLVPGWTFTKDGIGLQLPAGRVTTLSTRRAARDYNANVQAHLFFWAWVLAGGDDQVFLNDGSEGVVRLTGRPATLRVVGGAPTPGTGDPDEWHDAESDDEQDDEMDELTDPVEPRSGVDLSKHAGRRRNQRRRPR